MLARRFDGVEHHGLASGNQVISELSSVLLFLIAFVAQVVGEADEFPFGEPDGRREIGRCRLALHVEMRLHVLEQFGRHRLCHGTP